MFLSNQPPATAGQHAAPCAPDVLAARPDFPLSTEPIALRHLDGQTHETGRFADVGNVDNLTTIKQAADVVRRIEIDLFEHPDEWENSTLERFLEALAASLDDIPGTAVAGLLCPRSPCDLRTGRLGGLDPIVRPTRTIADYAPVFLRHHRVEGNTKDTYADTLRLHVTPFIGRARVAEMNRLAARGFFTTLEEAGRSPNTIRQAKVALAAMFTMAVADGFLDANPFHDVETPKTGGPRAIKIVTTAQYVNVGECLPTRPAQVLSTLMVCSGPGHLRAVHVCSPLSPGAGLNSVAVYMFRHTFAGDWPAGRWAAGPIATSSFTSRQLPSRVPAAICGRRQRRCRGG